MGSSLDDRREGICSSTMPLYPTRGQHFSDCSRFDHFFTGTWLLTADTALLKTSVASDVVIDVVIAVVVDVIAGVDVDEDVVDDEELDAGFATDGATEPFVEDV